VELLFKVREEGDAATELPIDAETKLTGAQQGHLS